MTGRRVASIYAPGQVWLANDGETTRTVMEVIPRSDAHEAGLRIRRFDGQEYRLLEVSMNAWVVKYRARVVPDAG